MPRIARVVEPGVPHHITQRGNRRLQTFFCEEDYDAYVNLLAEWCAECRMEIWAYCLMPNHVHLIAVPATEEGLRQAIGEAHRRYTRCGCAGCRSGTGGRASGSAAFRRIEAKETRPEAGHDARQREEEEEIRKVSQYRSARVLLYRHTIANMGKDIYTPPFRTTDKV